MKSTAPVKIFQTLFLTGLVIVLSSALQAQNVAIGHCQGSCPGYSSSLAANRSNMVVHNLYAAGLNGDTGKADWVAYQLTKDAIGVASLLPRFWQPDELVRLSGIEELAEAEALGFSLAEISSGDNPYGGFNEPPYWAELNNLSNMVPMPTPLRRGAWLQLEQTLNRIVTAERKLGVISGPLYLINEPLSISVDAASLNPAAYFKVVIAEGGIASFVFPEDLTQTDRFCDYQADLRQIELMSSLNLFPKSDPVTSPKLLRDLGCN